MDLTSQVARETGVQLQPVGTAFVMKEMNDQIIPQQLASLGLAAVLVFRKRGDDAPSDTALRFVATPVLANALGLAIGFTAMLLSPLQIHVTLSILMWVTMITSAVLSLTFLPTITAGRRDLRQQ